MTLSALCLLVSLLVPQAATAVRNDGSLTVRADGREKVLSRADLAKLPRHELKLAAEAGLDAATMSGIQLWDVIQAAGFHAPEASGRQRAVMTVKLTGADGQNAILAFVEVDPSFSSRMVLLGDLRNGKALEAVEGPWRVFIPTDIRHARWIRGLVAIEVTSLK